MTTVLIATKNRAELNHLKTLLRGQYDVLEATSTSSVSIQIQSCDLVILDANMNEVGGIDLLMAIAASTALPILILTDPEDPQLAAEAMRCGAQNYLVKTPNYHDFLCHAIHDALQASTQQDQMRRTIERLQARIQVLEASIDRSGPLSEVNVSDQPSTERLPAAETTLQSILKPIESISESPPNSDQPPSGLIEQLKWRMQRGEVNLPSYPSMASSLRQMIQDQASIDDITALLNRDTAIVATLIRVANSAYYRGISDSQTLADAIGRLGLKTTYNYVEVMANRTLYTTAHAGITPLLSSLWTHSLACAHTSKQLALHLQLAEPETLFALGLLHDIGMLVLLQLISELDLQGNLDEPLEPAITSQLVHVHHDSFGSALMKYWKLPTVFVEITKRHEHPPDLETSTPELLVVHCANQIASSIGYGHTLSSGERFVVEENEVATHLRVTPEMLTSIEHDVLNLMAECDFSLAS